MRVSAKLNRPLVVCLIVACALGAGALVAGGIAVSTQQENRDVERPVTTLIRTPTKALDVIASSTPSESAIEVSRRLFSRSPVAVLAGADDPAAQRIAIRSATTLGVPVLIDHRGADAELARLKASTVLTFGRTPEVSGSRAVPVDDARAAEAVAALRGTYGPRPVRTTDAIVVTRSRSANAAAVANARTAGAEVIEIPTADPRRTPAAARTLAARPDTPVIALGTPFAEGFAYTLAAVRAHAAQPTGGYLALPGRHYAAMYGHPGTPSLGVLGEQGVKASVARVRKLVRKYDAAGSGTIVPTFEVIATVASAGAGKDKNYSSETSVAALRPLVDAAGKAGVYVILDLQPGRTDFLTQAKRYRSLLERPYVGLALDPEWRLKKGQKHLRQIGSVRVSEINRVGDWLAELTRTKTLPQKLFVLHQFSPSMIKGRRSLNTEHPELATVIHVDGSGRQSDKRGTWKLLHKNAPKGVFWGWKNFVDEDPHMLTVQETWRTVRPLPGLITYQ
jgi:hypothetical protein